LLQACSSSDDVAAATPVTHATYASLSDIVIAGSQRGPTPFISFVELRGTSVENLANVSYVIQAKPGTVSKPASVEYSLAALRERSYVSTAASIAILPVFGLYADHSNHLDIRFTFRDGSVQTASIDIATTPYLDPRGVYDNVRVLQSRSAQSALGFDYFAMKSIIDSPVIVDTDGNIRWVAGVSFPSTSTAFVDNGFVIGDQTAPTLRRLELDGSAEQRLLIPAAYKNFHHNIEPGKHGMLIELDTTTESGALLAEISPVGAILKEWDFAVIVESFMYAQGDDASAFVRRGVDWFHMNGAWYDGADDSIIASSRENFVIKVDYDTGDIIWILGDPTKYWYTFPSLRTKALTITNGGLYPMGQHAPSMTSDGLLMVFNNGAESFNQPTGAPVGGTLTYSTVSAYRIDEQTLTAEVAWVFDYSQSIFSRICSSAYEAPGETLLVSYAFANRGRNARLVALDTNRNVVFDFEYPSVSGCATSWNAVPIPLDDLRFD
jgi:hypothetical protein